MNYYDYSSTSTPSLFSGITSGSIIWMVVSLVLAIVGAFLVYFMFVKSDKKMDNKFLSWLRSFLDFQSMLIEPILKISYIFVALFITLGSFSVIGTSFLSFVVTLVVGNLVARFVYEVIMVLIGIWQNTKEINKKTK